MKFDRGYQITNESHDAPSNTRQVVHFAEDGYHRERANPSNIVPLINFPVTLRFR